MRFALIGCGYVADFYMMSANDHETLEIAKVYDRDPARLETFTSYYNLRKCDSIDDILNDTSIDAVINLTNPSSHFEVSMACLRAGKHVYSEKPFALALEEAKQLVDTAREMGLQLSSAPSSLLGEAAQSVWHAIRSGHLGEPRLVYANMDDGMPFKMGCQHWSSKTGAPWPYRDEFEVGAVFEHAGYVLTWLVAFFGPIRTICGASGVLFPDKMPDVPADTLGPDMSIATITFENGVIARISCTVIADEDRALEIYGTERTLVCEDFWKFYAPVYTWRQRPVLPRIRQKIYNRLHLWAEHFYPAALKEHYKPFPGRKKQQLHRVSQMDFLRGPAEMAEAIAQGRTPRLSAQFSLHVDEACIALSNLGIEGSLYRMTTSCDPVEPMPWAM